MDKPFQILNASAGSGKTFSLVRNYLRLLLTDKEDRAELGQIVAMTFTNKAALEMKTRILADLNKLAYGGATQAQFLKETAAFVGIAEDKIIRNSKYVLRKLLHQYENFNVLTIDKFNLRLIKSFSRDLNLPEQFEIVINEKELMERSIDELLQQVDAKDKGKIFRLALNYSQERLLTEGKWNIKGNLQDKAGTITKESNFQTIQQLIETDFTEEDKTHLITHKKELIGKAKMLAEQILHEFQNLGENPDLYAGKSITSKRLEKFRNFEDLEKVNPDYFNLTPAFLANIQKTSDNLGTTNLLEAVLAFSDWTNKNLIRLRQVDETLKQLPFTLLLRELAISLESIRERESTILISEFNKLVSQLVKNEDAPFIYERLGNRYKHFFLDEFQDTSHLQWTNLVPMVHESLAHSNFNFIVGDPKQSIYRFKNGVAEQFVCLPKIYNPDNDSRIALKSDFFHQMGEKKPLPNNWRSAEEIVAFNNLFFAKIKGSLSESGQSYYEDLHQVPKGKKGGFVQIEYSLKTEDQSDSDDETEESLSENEYKCVQYVNEVIADGYYPGDICILAKTKKSCNEFANALKKAGYQVVSADSLLVDSDQGVRLLIRFLSWRNNLLNIQKAQLFASSYFEYNFPNHGTERYFNCFVTDENGKSYFSIELFYQVSGLAKEQVNRPFSSIYSCLQEIIDVIAINRNNSYIKQLLDLAFNYDTKVGPILANFLTFYHTEGKKTNVQIVQNRNAIKIMTAHKSKGLEFPVVIVPTLKFDSGIKDSLFLSSSPFFLEASVSKKNVETGYFSDVISKEIDDVLLDTINQLYVTFTRPVDRLYIFEKKSAKQSPFQKLVAEVISDMPNTEKSDNSMLMTWGTKPEIGHETEEEVNSYELSDLKNKLWFPEISLRDQNRRDEDGLTKQIRLGKQFHSLMEESTDFESVQLLISEGLSSGRIALEFKDQLVEMTATFFDHEISRSLFENGKHLNERTLIVDETKRLRPDKLILLNDTITIVDFKTGEPLAKHEKQVQEYAEVLKRMGYSEVVGYLYYSNLAEYKKVAINTTLF